MDIKINVENNVYFNKDLPIIKIYGNKVIDDFHNIKHHNEAYMLNIIIQGILNNTGILR